MATQAHGRVADAISVASAAVSFDHGEKFQPSSDSRSHKQNGRRDRVFYEGARDTTDQDFQNQQYDDDCDPDYYDEDDEY